MDQFRQHFRSTVIVDQQLLDQVPPRALGAGPLEDPVVIIAGNRVAAAGGSLANHEMIIAADLMTTLGGGDSKPRITTKVQ